MNCVHPGLFVLRFVVELRASLLVSPSSQALEPGIVGEEEPWRLQIQSHGRPQRGPSGWALLKERIQTLCFGLIQVPDQFKRGTKMPSHSSRSLRSIPYYWLLGKKPFYSCYLEESSNKIQKTNAFIKIAYQHSDFPNFVLLCYKGDSSVENKYCHGNSTTETKLATNYVATKKSQSGKMKTEPGGASQVYKRLVVEAPTEIDEHEERITGFEAGSKLSGSRTQEVASHSRCT